MKSANPCRGEIWLADLNPVRGHEQVSQVEDRLRILLGCSPGIPRKLH